MERGQRAVAKLHLARMLGRDALHAGQQLRAKRLTGRSRWQVRERARTGKRGKPFPARRYAGAENCRLRQSRTPRGTTAVLRNAAALVRSTMNPSFPCLLTGYIESGIVGNCKSRRGCLCATPHQAFLTQQRFSPKLRLTNYMAVNRANCRAIGLLLLILFLSAQIHFLSDLDSGQVGAHLCPICSVLSFAILLALPILCSLPVMGRAEQAPSLVFVTQGISRSTSPRAPPAL